MVDIKSQKKNAKILANLKSRLQKIETNIKIVIAIFAILGLSGAWVFTKVASLGNQVEELSKKVKLFQKEVVKAVKKLELAKDDAVNMVNDAKNEAIDSLGPAAIVAVNNASEGIRIVQSGSGRLGWDNVPNWTASVARGHRHHVDFDIEFQESPKVRAFLSGLFWDGDSGALGVEVENITSTGFNLVLTAYEGSRIRSIQFAWVAHK